MHRANWLILPASLLVGCSTSPCADFLDHFWPAKPPASAAGSFGGVCNPTPTGPGVSGGGPIGPPALSGPGPGAVPVVPAPGPGMPNSNTPYIPGGAVPAPAAGTPPPLSNLPAPDLNGMPTSTPGSSTNSAQPLPAPPSGSAPPF